MLFKQERESLRKTRTEGAEFFESKNLIDSKPSFSNSIGDFFSEIRNAKDLIFQEREILVFVAIQWLVLAVMLVLFIKGYDWIPPEFLGQNNHSHENKLEETYLGILSLLWGTPIIITASYPLALMNACIVSCHYLKASGQPSTFKKCYLLAHNNLGRLWSFTVLDILTRNRKQDSVKSKILTFVWNISTIGFVPALVSGKTFMESASDSLAILKKNPVKAMGLYFGYKALKIVVFVAVLISIFMLIAFTVLLTPPETNSLALMIFVVLGLGIILILCFVLVYMFLRPLYLLAIAKLYTDTIPLHKESVHFQRFSIPLAATFLTFFLGTLVIAIFVDDVFMQDKISRLTLFLVPSSK